MMHSWKNLEGRDEICSMEAIMITRVRMYYIDLAAMALFIPHGSGCAGVGYIIRVGLRLGTHLGRNYQ